NGAFGAFAFGIGQSELRQVFLTQTVWRRKPKAMRVRIDGSLAESVSAKDVVLHVIATIGANGGSGYVLEYTGSCIERMSMEARMTVCNMSIEAGSQAGMIAPDATTIAYLEARWRANHPHPDLPPEGEGEFAGAKPWTRAVSDWSELRADEDAVYDREVAIDAAAVQPMVTWGTSLDDASPVRGCVPDPAALGDAERRARMERALAYMDLRPGTPMTDIAIDAASVQPMVTWGTSLDDASPVRGCVPDPAALEDAERRARMERSLAYMDLEPGTPMTDIVIDLVFIGSCSNARIEDLRSAARVLEGRRARVPAVVSPGSRTVKRQAEAEGLDTIFRDAGFEWRDSGCSMCVGSNGDTVQPGRRCASTSPRNFEGRQGPGARTHVMSPAMAAAAAVTGKITDVRALLGGG
ncbi:MAG TPA: aconitase family protein, partial [Burkholderiales bacterium]|nr:aconitase family protein [Burkholderiales bacterium]